MSFYKVILSIIIGCNLQSNYLLAAAKDYQIYSDETIEINDKNSKYDNLEPTMSKFLLDLKKEDGPPIYTLPVKKARAILDKMQAKSVNKIPAQIEDLVIPVGPNGELSIRIVRPFYRSTNLPVVMYFHGGGWILGNKYTHDRLIRLIANGADAAVVFVNYTPAPEAQYPKQLQEAYAATKFIAQNGFELGLDPTRLAVVGDSVGGNMAAAVALLAKEKNGPKIDFQALLYPVTDSNFETKSFNEFAEDFWLTKEAMKWFWNAYAPIFSKRNRPTVSPLQATVDQLRGLPPTFIITNEFDVLRDEGEAFAHKLMRAGVDVIAIRILGAIHDLVLLDPLKDSEAAKNAIEFVIQQLRKQFYQNE